MPPTFALAISMLVGLMLQMAPLAQALLHFRPDWLSLLIISWAMIRAQSLSITLVFCMGLILDVHQGVLLGQNAIALTIVAYLVLTYRRRFELFPLWQKAAVVFLLLLLKQSLVFWVSGLQGHAPPLKFYLFPPLTGAMIWPFVHIGVQLLQPRAR